jgi:putative MATE family efflux protein
MRITSEEILNGPAGKTLIRMTMPMILAILMMILFTAVDIYFIGLLGTVELAAISFTFPVTFSISSLALGLGIATSVLLAQAIGEGSEDKARRITTDGILLAALLVVLVSLGGWLTIDWLFGAMGATTLTLPFIHEYMDIWYLFVGLFVIPMVGNAAIRATGDTRWPSIMMMVSGLTNVILDPILIFGFGPVPAMGVTGAAVATVIAWSLGFVIAIWILRVRENLLAFNIPNVVDMLVYWKLLFRMGMPISIANMLTPIAAAIMTAFISRYGEHAVAGFGAGSRIEALMLVVSFALTAALSPFMAQNLGAGKTQRAITALKIALRFSILFHLCLYPLIVIFSPWLAAIFSSDPEVIKVTRLFLLIMPAGIGLYGALIVINTAFNAARQTHKTLVISLIRLCCCYVPLVAMGGLLFDIPGLFIGACLGNGIATLIGWHVLRQTYRQLEQQHLSSWKTDPGNNKVQEFGIR